MAKNTSPTLVVGSDEVSRLIRAAQNKTNPPGSPWGSLGFQATEKYPTLSRASSPSAFGFPGLTGTVDQRFPAPANLRSFLSLVDRRRNKPENRLITKVSACRRRR